MSQTYKIKISLLPVFNLGYLAVRDIETIHSIKECSQHHLGLNADGHLVDDLSDVFFFTFFCRQNILKCMHH